MKIATIEDAQWLWVLVNDPINRVWSAWPGAPLVDVGKYFGGDDFAVLDDRGAFSASRLADGRYLIHVSLAPSCRGASAMLACRDALEIAYIYQPVRVMVAAIPDVNVGALTMARWMGFLLKDRRENVWPIEGGKCGLSIWEQTRDNWSSRWLEEVTSKGLRHA